MAEIDERLDRREIRAEMVLQYPQLRRRFKASADGIGNKLQQATNGLVKISDCDKICRSLISTSGKFAKDDERARRARAQNMNKNEICR